MHTVTVGFDRVVSVGRNETISIGAARTEIVTGAETIRLLDARDTDIVRSDRLVVHETRDEVIEGESSGRYLGGRTVFVAQGDIETVAGSDKSVTVHGEYGIEVDDCFLVKRGDTEVYVESVIRAESPTRIELVAGDSSITLDQDGTLMLAATKQIELVCGSASLLMKSDGTLQVSTSRAAEIASGSSLVRVTAEKVTAQSAQVDVNGDSAVNVKGGTINLN